MNLKKILFKTIGTLGTAVLISCATIKPTGSIDIAYVPRRADDRFRKNELKFGVDTRLNFPIRSGYFYIGGGGTAYGEIADINGLIPHRIESNAYLGFENDRINIYARHSSTHPIGDNERTIYLPDDVRKIPYTIKEFDYIEEIGLKLKF